MNVCGQRFTKGLYKFTTKWDIDGITEIVSDLKQKRKILKQANKNTNPEKKQKTSQIKK